MSEVIENNLVGDNRPEYSVTEVSGLVKGLIESEFEYVRIRGEIWSSFKSQIWPYLSRFKR